MTLSQKKCVPCEAGGAPLTKEEIAVFLPHAPGWTVVEDDKKISRTFSFKNFKEALVFVNTVGEIAEAEGHHPDIHVHYNKVLLELWTHAIGGLFENDFILAAKINEIK